MQTLSLSHALLETQGSMNAAATLNSWALVSLGRLLGRSHSSAESRRWVVDSAQQREGEKTFRTEGAMCQGPGVRERDEGGSVWGGGMERNSDWLEEKWGETHPHGVSRQPGVSEVSLCRVLWSPGQKEENQLPVSGELCHLGNVSRPVFRQLWQAAELGLWTRLRTEAQWHPVTSSRARLGVGFEHVASDTWCHTPLPVRRVCLCPGQAPKALAPSVFPQLPAWNLDPGSVGI